MKYSKIKALILESQKTAFVNGRPVEYEKEVDITKLKDNSDVDSIETASGKRLKEGEGVEFSTEETQAIAREVGKALTSALREAGDEIDSAKIHNVEPNSFDIFVKYKNNFEDDFAFHIDGDTLHLTDFSFDKEIGEVGIKPSGEVIVHKDVLKNNMLKHFQSLNEEATPSPSYADQEGWSEKKSKMYDGVAYKHNYIEELKDELKKAKSLGDKYEIKDLTTRIKHLRSELKSQIERFKSLEEKLETEGRGEGNEKQIVGQELVDYIMDRWGWSEEKTLNHLSKQLGNVKDVKEQEYNKDIEVQADDDEEYQKIKNTGEEKKVIKEFEGAPEIEAYYKEALENEGYDFSVSPIKRFEFDDFEDEKGVRIIKIKNLNVNGEQLGDIKLKQDSGKWYLISKGTGNSGINEEDHEAGYIPGGRDDYYFGMGHAKGYRKGYSDAKKWNKSNVGADGNIKEGSYNSVAQGEFGMDYEQLGSSEKEWVRDEIENSNYKKTTNTVYRGPKVISAGADGETDRQKYSRILAIFKNASPEKKKDMKPLLIKVAKKIGIDKAVEEQDDKQEDISRDAEKTARQAYDAIITAKTKSREEFHTVRKALYRKYDNAFDRLTAVKKMFKVE